MFNLESYLKIKIALLECDISSESKKRELKDAKNSLAKAKAIVASK